MSRTSPKLCFAASSGGHYEQLMMLKPLMQRYDSFVLTEKTQYKAKAKAKEEDLLCGSDQPQGEETVLLKLVVNAFHCLGIFIKERPAPAR